MITKGDKVEVLDDNLKGFVRAVKGNIILVALEHGFEQEFRREELIKISDEPIIDMASPPTPLFDKNIPLKKSTNKKRKLKTEAKAIDLHIHELLESEKGLTAHDKLQLQLRIVRKEMDHAINNRCTSLIFIHGIGKGVLKRQIGKVLQREYPSCIHYDASYQKYGLGATEVRIYSKN